MIPGAITARSLHKVPVAHAIPPSTRRLARRVIPSATSNWTPLDWEQVKDDPEWADLERKWQGYAESNSLDKIAKDFQEKVDPILAEIQLSDYVSDLRSKPPPSPASGAGPHPPTTLQWVDLVLAGGAGYMVCIHKPCTPTWAHAPPDLATGVCLGMHSLCLNRDLF